MTIIEHLEDLRKMFVRVLAILSVSLVGTYLLSIPISEILLIPLRENLTSSQMGEVVYLGVMDKIVSQFQVSFWTGIIISAPLWFREVWKFLRPGLYPNEIKIILPFLIAGFILFYLGISFGYFILLPFTIDSLMNAGLSDVKSMINLKDYLVLCSQALVIIGLLFQIPNIMVILGLMGVVTKYSLRQMRKPIYFILAVLSAIITPPDVISMLAFWAPLIFLFELGIWAVHFIVHPYLHRQTR